MRKLLITALIALLPLTAQAQSLLVARSQTGAVGATVSAVDPSGNTTKVVLPGAMLADSSGAEKGTASNPLITTPATGASSIVTQPTAANLNAQVVGNVAAGTADSGNGVKVAGVYIVSPSNLSGGQRGDFPFSINGVPEIAVGGTNQMTADAQPAALYLKNHGGSSAPLATGLTLLGPGGWDRGFTCAQTASVNVTAGNTTQIVGLSGTTVIRVCSVSVSMSAAGTVSFLSGTGTNCGTPSTIMTAMTLATGTPWQQSAPAGGSLFRSTAGGEICVTAATGNVTGFISYAQF